MKFKCIFFKIWLSNFTLNYSPYNKDVEIVKNVSACLDNINYYFYSGTYLNNSN